MVYVRSELESLIPPLLGKKNERDYSLVGCRAWDKKGKEELRGRERMKSEARKKEEEEVPTRNDVFWLFNVVLHEFISNEII